MLGIHTDPFIPTRRQQSTNRRLIRSLLCGIALCRRLLMSCQTPHHALSCRLHWLPCCLERSGFAQVQLPHAAREGLLRLTLSAAMCEHVPASHNHGCVSWWKTRSTTDEPDLRCPPHDAALNDQHPVIEESGARAVASDTVHRTQVIQPVD
ncbi:hypothetical protein HBI56_236660 [Parastagonospora nodorum]|nr:hypothetical protein HBH56_244440 [Parastagonospora nodorum]KAH3944157.1 hypothetical protein HBH53_165580 [Parastagonospora nodorum]KAH4011598.1 hypothetical protein HBI13_199510 [Parastagonospora nodorum]KAH4044303.1 hypothetical protein HBH49_222570 [Parastagonospora nodorum]KAH4116981.1 hypothetical protein HBH47_161030 [Parastagonospora nodorum]